MITVPFGNQLTSDELKIRSEAKLHRLIFLDIALKYQGLAIGEDGIKPPDPDQFLMLPSKQFRAMENERRQLIRELAGVQP